MAEILNAIGTDKRTSTGWETIVITVVALFTIYVLAIGPLVMLVDRKVLSPKSAEVLQSIYIPIEWAYEKTPLHKPIGMYLHLWSKRFKADGDQH